VIVPSNHNCLYNALDGVYMCIYHIICRNKDENRSRTLTLLLVHVRGRGACAKVEWRCDMYRSVVMAGVLAGGMVSGQVLEACTATSVMAKAIELSVRINDDYSVVYEVVQEQIARAEHWTNSASTHAAAGTVLYEAAYHPPLERHVSSGRSAVESFLDARTTTHGMGTVRNHATYHGQEWETGFFGGKQSGVRIPGWYYEQSSDLALFHPG